MMMLNLFRKKTLARVKFYFFITLTLILVSGLFVSPTLAELDLQDQAATQLILDKIETSPANFDPLLEEGWLNSETELPGSVNTDTTERYDEAVADQPPLLTINPDPVIVPLPVCSEGQHFVGVWVEGYYDGDWPFYIWQEGNWQGECIADEIPDQPACLPNQTYQGQWQNGQNNVSCLDAGWRRFGFLDWRYVCLEYNLEWQQGEWQGECTLDELVCEEFNSQSGWYGEYFNYSREHPDMNLPAGEWPDDSHGDPLGTWDTDWYDQSYFRFYRVDSSLDFGEDFFPFDPWSEELDNGHEYHFGVHWRTKVETAELGDYDFNLTSDDDAWVYLNGMLIAQNPGIHAPTTINGTMSLDGSDIVDIFFAERHTVRSHLNFQFENYESLNLIPLPEDCSVDELIGGICGVKFNDLNQNAIQEEGEENLADWTINLNGMIPSSEAESWADDVIYYHQGNIHYTIPSAYPLYDDPTKALGEAQGNNSSDLVDLGAGGEIILYFDNIIENNPGDDIEVIVSAALAYGICENYPLMTEVYASQDGVNWQNLGNGCISDTFDLGALDWAQYLKFVDITDQQALADYWEGLYPDTNFRIGGYNIDGVKALHSVTLQQLDSQVTTEDGYCFNELAPSAYFICEENQNSWTNSTPACQNIEVTGDQTETVDFGNYFVNRPPHAPSAHFGVLENVPQWFGFVCSDLDGQPLSFSIINDVDFGNVSSTEVTHPHPNLTHITGLYTPNQDYVGEDSFTYECNDGYQSEDRASASGVISFTVIPQEDNNGGGGGGGEGGGGANGGGGGIPVFVPSTASGLTPPTVPPAVVPQVLGEKITAPEDTPAPVEPAVLGFQTLPTTGGAETNPPYWLIFLGLGLVVMGIKSQDAHAKEN